MAHSKAVWTLRWTRREPPATAALNVAGLLTLGLLAGGCTDIEPCDEQGETQSCTCGEGAPGSQLCLPEKVWDDCVCEDPPDAGMAGGAGGASGSSGSGGAGGGGAGSGGRASAGAGGSSGSGGTGGTGTSAADDAGMDEPLGDGGLAGAGAGGAGGSSGAGGAGGSSGAGGAGPDPYRDCAEDGECGDGNTCLSLTDFLTEFHVCAPACTVSTLCPVPAGSYEASIACVSDGCRLDCTPNPDPLFGEPLSCPSGLSCRTADASGTSYCYH